MPLYIEWKRKKNALSTGLVAALTFRWDERVWGHIDVNIFIPVLNIYVCSIIIIIISREYGDYIRISSWFSLSPVISTIVWMYINYWDNYWLYIIYFWLGMKDYPVKGRTIHIVIEQKKMISCSIFASMMVVIIDYSL